ncbi:MAG: hypothetical protein L6R38_006639 [Xanthoria sp. 2 TBL-2021]|nr:MAG: hypothetical protein L6R38_006639 [Xanthoria sp. 2 TBL-2021]
MAAPDSLDTTPHFSFKFLTGEQVVLRFEKGLGRMAVLIRARHELDPNPKSMEYITLTRIIRKFQAAFTLEWEDDDPAENNDEAQEYDETIDPEKRDEILLRNLDGIVAICRKLREMKIPPGKELQDMMGLIIAALKGFSEDGTRLKQWLAMEESFSDAVAEEMLRHESNEEKKKEEEKKK